ncbi:MAG: MarR family winged helix-turn-helix transcriptional regulator, partial [Planktomarina sp.]
ARLAKSFNLTRGAMTNTLAKLEWAGYIHVRPDWDDARRKQVVISPAGRIARDLAFADIAPVLAGVTGEASEEKLRSTLATLRDLRSRLATQV